MIALSVRQPWAWAILHAGKDVENRRWSLPERWVGQRIMLHASKGCTCDEYDDGVFTIAIKAKDVTVPPLEALPRGAIVGAFTITGELHPVLGPEPRMNGWHATSQYGWLLADIVELPMVIPCSGRMGFWPLPHEVADAVRRLRHG